jgi:hypothetical protein
MRCGASLTPADGRVAIGALTGAFEILNRSFVPFRRQARSERSQIAAFAGFWIFLPRVKTIAAGLKFPNHRSLLADQMGLMRSTMVKRKTKEDVPYSPECASS